VNISFIDLHTNARTTCPIVPDFEIERPQGFAEVGLLGGPPQIQATARGARKWSSQLELWGADGFAFFENFLEPAFGAKTGRPHVVQVAWGNRSRDSFQGVPFGQPPTTYEFGGDNLFAVSFELVLVEVINVRAREVSSEGRLVSSSFESAYIAKKGDTLGSVARAKHILPAVLAAANDYPDFELKVGQKIVIPR
jgi:hypothetical protein